MGIRNTIAGLVAATGLVAGAAFAAPTAGAQESAPEPAPSTSLAEVLLSDGDTFDRNSYDFDIVTQAVLAVLAEKPDSPVGLLTRGDVPLTAFVPNDRAFWALVGDLTGKLAAVDVAQVRDAFRRRISAPAGIAVIVGGNG